jgi:type II secretory pathway component PulJ
MRGVTLIEIMVSISISLFLISMLLHFYLVFEKNRNAQGSLYTIAHQARRVFAVLDNDISTNRIRHYFIKKNKANVSCLYIEEGNKKSILADHIQDIHFLYRVGSSDREAKEVSHWKSVVGVTTMIVIQSGDLEKRWYNYSKR